MSELIPAGRTIVLEDGVARTIFAPDKSVKLWADVAEHRGAALSALREFLKNYRASHHGARCGVVYSFGENADGTSKYALYVYQTKTQYAIRKA